jgi:hypothetical protein
MIMNHYCHYSINASSNSSSIHQHTNLSFQPQANAPTTTFYSFSLIPSLDTVMPLDYLVDLVLVVSNLSKQGFGDTGGSG